MLKWTYCIAQQKVDRKRFGIAAWDDDKHPKKSEEALSVVQNVLFFSTFWQSDFYTPAIALCNKIAERVLTTYGPLENIIRNGSSSKLFNKNVQLKI